MVRARQPGVRVRVARPPAVLRGGVALGAFSPAHPGGRSELLERLSSYQAPGAPAGHPGRDLGSAACQLAPPYPPQAAPWASDFSLPLPALTLQRFLCSRPGRLRKKRLKGQGQELGGRRGKQDGRAVTAELGPRAHEGCGGGNGREATHGAPRSSSEGSVRAMPGVP